MKRLKTLLFALIVSISLSAQITTQTVTITQTDVGLVGEDRNNFDPTIQSEGYLNNIQVPAAPTCDCSDPILPVMTSLELEISISDITTNGLPPDCDFNAVFGNIYMEGGTALSLTAEDAPNYDILSAPGCTGWGTGIATTGSTTVDLLAGDCTAPVLPENWIGVDIIPAIFWGPTNPPSNPCNMVNGNGITGGYVSLEYTVNLTATFECICPVPVEIGDFKGVAKKDHNQVIWITHSETNNEFQILERSSDGRTWMEVEKKLGEESSVEIKEYEVLDYEPFPVSFYRIKSIDLDGSTEFSNIISVSREKRDFGVSLSPNPADNYISFLGNNVDNRFPLEIKIMDIQGRTLKEYSFENGEVPSPTDISFLSPGIYLIQAINGIHASGGKFIKK